MGPLKQLTCLALVCLYGFPSTGQAQEKYTIRPTAGHEVVLSVEKTGLLAGKKHRFVFADYSGSLQYVRDHPERSTVQFAVQVKSLQVTDDWIKEKDRSKIHEFALSEKMLDAKRFSELKFVSSKIVPGTDGNHFRADGSLTIHGETRPISVMVSVAAAEGGNLLVDGSSFFKLSDFHLARPSAALGSVGTKDEVATTFRLISSPETRP